MAIKAMRILGEPSTRRSTRLSERRDEREVQAEQLDQAVEPEVENAKAPTSGHGEYDLTVF